jgi:hypothetical protein
MLCHAKAQRRAWVVGSDYLPAWEIPALAAHFKRGATGAAALSAELARRAADGAPQLDAVVERMANAVAAALGAVESVRGGGAGYELVRFDFIAGEDGGVTLLEVNL